jgi:hypothetical protein
MTRACVQYTTGKDPLTFEDLYIPRGGRERRLQKALVRWRVPENQKLVEEALREAGREDLLPRFHHALKQRSGKAGKPARAPAGMDLDTCG